MPVVDEFNKLGTNLAGLALNTANTSVELADKGVKTVGVVANAGLDAAGKIVDSGLQTAANVVENAGKITTSGLQATVGVVDHAGTAAVAGVNTVASLVGIVRDLTIRTEAISKNAASRQEEVEKLKNSEIKKQVDIGMVKNTEETQNAIETIKTEAENAKIKIRKDAENEREREIFIAENKKRDIEATYEQEKINQQLQHQSQKNELQENFKNYKESLVYGFTDDTNFTPGSTKISNMLKKKMFYTSEKVDFQYFIIVGVLDKQNEKLPFFELHPEDLSYKQDNDIKRTNMLTYKDTDGNNVRIVFKKKYITGFFSRYETIIDVYDVNTNTLIITGIAVFLKKKYFKLNKPVTFAPKQSISVLNLSNLPRQKTGYAYGGKSRRQIKKHRVGYKKSQKTKKHNNTKTRNKRRTKL